MLTSLLFVIAGTAMTACLAGLEHRLYGRWLTPSTLLAVPQMGILGAALILAEPLGFVPVHPKAAALLLVSPWVLWCGSLLVLAPQRQRLRSLGSASPSRLGETEGRRAVLVVSWLVVAVMAIAFVRAFRAGDFLARVVQLEFQLAFQAGASGLVRPVAMLLVVYWLGTLQRGERAAWLTAGALLLFLFLSFVKGTILIPVVGGLIYRVVSGRTGLTPRAVLGVLALGVTVASVVYVTEMGLDNPSLVVRWSFVAVLARRTAGYLFAGVLGLSQNLAQGITPRPSDWPIIVAPAWNLGAHLLGLARVSNVPEDAFLIDLDTPVLILAQSNVRTLFGTLYVFWGWWGVLGWGLALGAVVSLVFAGALRTANSWLLVVFCLLGAGLFFGWFEYYFWHPFWYVSVALGLLFAGLVQAGWKGSARSAGVQAPERPA